MRGRPGSKLAAQAPSWTEAGGTSEATPPTAKDRNHGPLSPGQALSGVRTRSSLSEAVRGRWQHQLMIPRQVTPLLCCNCHQKLILECSDGGKRPGV